MIKDNIKFSHLYYNIHKDFKKVFETLNALNTNTPAGKIEISENVWINVCPNANPQGDRYKFEAHREFIDIHFVVSGEEAFMYEDCHNLKTTKEYCKEDDYLLLEGKGCELNLKKGDFAVVFPQDAHAPAVKIKDKNHFRAVAKIRIK